MADDVQVLIEPLEEAALAGEGMREMVVRQSQLLELLGDPDPGRLEVYGPDLAKDPRNGWSLLCVETAPSTQRETEASTISRACASAPASAPT